MMRDTALGIPGGDDERVGEEETLADFAPFGDASATAAARQAEPAFRRASLLFDDMQQAPYYNNNTCPIVL